MKKTITLGTLLLGCCLGAAAQMGSTPNQMPQRSTPPTFPQDQTGQTPSNPTTPADPSAIPPDTHAPGQTSHAQAADHAVQAGDSQTTTVQGCLSRSSNGNIMLADQSGKRIQLRGESSQLNSYVGNEVRVDGMAVSKSRATAGSMSSPASPTSPASASPADDKGKQFNVSDIHKVADVCAAGANTKP
jgi:hypothetical protein